jgi:hypothetical protein
MIGQPCVPPSSPPGKKTPIPIEWEAAWPPSRYGHFGVKHLLPVLEFESLIVLPVTWSDYAFTAAEMSYICFLFSHVLKFAIHRCITVP